MKKLLSLLLALAMVLALAACTASSDVAGADDAADADVASGDENTDGNVLGEGETVFTLVVEDIDGTQTTFEIHTDETTVGAALLALELIDGTVESYGLYVKEVNGITADWDEDQTYWAFYEDGNYAAYGVDATEIDPSVTYSLVKTQG